MFIFIPSCCVFPLTGSYSQQSTAATTTAAASVSPTSTTVHTMECPQASMMCNDAEGEPWKMEITLMYAQQVSYAYPQAAAGSVPSEKKEPEKTLRELLEEQDIGMWMCRYVCHCV